MLTIIVPLLLGFNLLSLLWPKQQSFEHDLLIKGSIAMGLGFGISSILFFLWLLALGPNSNFLIFETTLLLLAFSFYLIVKQTFSVPPEMRSEKPTWIGTKINRNISLAFYVLFIAAVLTFVFLSLRNPHGQWDAWAVWNMRARFIFRGGEHWKEAFSNLLDWSHPDYPLLIPLSIVRGWKIAGTETLLIPITLAALFTFSTIVLNVSSLAVIRSKSQSLLAGIVLLGTPFFIQHGASQYADVPLGFFFLSTLVLLTFYNRSSTKNHNLLFLAGMTAAFSAWTKNEGFIFLMSILAARSYLIVRMNGWKLFSKDIIIFSSGLMPILLFIIYFKAHIVPSPDFVPHDGLKLIIDRLTDSFRYIQILKAVAFESMNFTLGIISPFLLIIYFLFFGKTSENKDRIAVDTGFMTLFLMLTGYFFYYVITPYDLAWHLKYSLNRLLLQLWPSFVFCFFMLLKTPEEALLSNTESPIHV